MQSSIVLIRQMEERTHRICGTLSCFFLFLMSREDSLVALPAYCPTPRSLNLDGEESLYLKVSCLAGCGSNG